MVEGDDDCDCGCDMEEGVTVRDGLGSNTRGGAGGDW